MDLTLDLVTQTARRPDDSINPFGVSAPASGPRLSRQIWALLLGYRETVFWRTTADT
jgi:hypothetical protein